MLVFEVAIGIVIGYFLIQLILHFKEKLLLIGAWLVLYSVLIVFWVIIIGGIIFLVYPVVLYELGR